MARLDTCYRTLAAAARVTREDDQNAALRDRICEYFEEASSSSGADCEEGDDDDRQRSDGAATGRNDASPNPLAGLPLRAPPPALALDVRELLAFARRTGGGRGGGKGTLPPEVCALA